MMMSCPCTTYESVARTMFPKAKRRRETKPRNQKYRHFAPGQQRQSRLCWCLDVRGGPPSTDVHKDEILKTKTKTDFFWSRTGLVLRPTVSDHITAPFLMMIIFIYYKNGMKQRNEMNNKQ